MQVQDIMTTNVYSCGPGSCATDAARIMWERDVGAVPVLDGLGRPIGMLTDRDLCMAAYTAGSRLSDLSVASAMSKTSITCRLGDSVSTAERIMREHQIRRLPVVNTAGVMVGILSLNDIVLARTRSPVDKVAERVLGDVTQTLAAICQHRGTPSQTLA